MRTRPLAPLAVLLAATVTLAWVQGQRFAGGTFTASDGQNDIALVFDTSGSLVAYVNNEAFSRGSWDTSADTLMISPLEAPEGYGCAGSGRYLWSIADNKLTMKTVADDCEIRVQYFTGLVWTKG